MCASCTSPPSWTAPASPAPLPLIVGAQQFKGTDTSLSNATHATGRTGSIVYIHAVARVAEQQRTGNLHFFMIKTQATPNIQHFIYSILLTDNHDKIVFSVIKHIVHLKKKSTRRCRHYITSDRYSPQSPNNIGVSQHFVKKNSVKDHAYNQHIGRLNTNDATDSTFHWQTIITECLEECNKHTVGLFVWSRDHSLST